MDTSGWVVGPGRPMFERLEPRLLLDGATNAYAFFERPDYLLQSSDFNPLEEDVLPSQVILGDLNNDGYADIVTANEIADSISVLLANGDRSFNPPVSYQTGGGPHSVAIEDLNGDGSADIVAANRLADNVSVLLGNADGTFNLQGTYEAGNGPESVALGDFDGDGHVDIATANHDSNNLSILPGNGDGTFDAQVTYATGIGPSSLALGDLNGDSYLDVLTANDADDTISALLSNGDGTFAAHVDYDVDSGPESVLLGDLDEDGLLDIVTANRLASNISVLRGNGDGTFDAQVTYATGTEPWSVALGDLNDDGHWDVVTADHGEEAISVFLGNGDGTYEARVAYPVEAVPRSVAMGDVNGDSRVDVIVACSQSRGWGGLISVLLSDKEGAFEPYVAYAAGEKPGAVATGDLDGNGYDDIVVANQHGDNVSVFLNNGGGTFGSQATWAVGDGPTSVALGDFNGDQHVDIVTSNRLSDDVSVLLGNGDGTFSLQLTSQVGGGPAGIAVEDLDADGFADIVTANEGGSTVSVLLSNGDGTFEGHVAYAAGGEPCSVALGDLNGDDNADIVTTNYGDNTVSVFMGNGDGTFDSQVAYVVGVAPSSVALLDLNDDTYLDLVTANAESDTVSLLLGNGDGTFGAEVAYVVGDRPVSVALGDLDSDGNVDIVAANYEGDDVSVLLASGDGTFEPQVVFSVGRGPLSLALADLDEDGLVEVITAGLVDESISVLVGVKDRMFRYWDEYYVGPGVNHVTLGDLNRDGHADIVATILRSYNDDFVAVLLGNGNGTFQPRVTYPVGNEPGAAALSDLNGDGHLDIAVPNRQSNDVSVFLGNGDGTLASQVAYVAGNVSTWLDLEDFDNDGYRDILVSSRATDDVSVLFGNGDGTFAPQEVVYAPEEDVRWAVMADVNGDGVSDLVVAEEWQVSVLLGNGDGTFAARFVSEVVRYASPKGLADLNGDGYIDLVSLDYSVWNSQVAVVLGNGDGTFSPPTTYPVAGYHSAWSTGPVTGDINGDGYVDVVIGSVWSGRLGVLLNKGNGALGPVMSYLATDSGPITLGDLDGDGRTDMVDTQARTSVAIHLNRAESIEHSPFGATTGPVDTIRLRFPYPMDENSFSPSEDVLSLQGPGGVLEVNGFDWLDAQTLEVHFTPQSDVGTYRLELAPTVLKQNGSELDQDADGTPGEIWDDVYEATFRIDAVSPRVVTHRPAGDVTGTVDYVELLFSEEIDQRTFERSDIRIVGPGGGEITPSSVESVMGSRFRIGFSSQTDLGGYTLEVGPGIADLAGNLLDQNRDGIGGEDPDDIYSGTFTISDVDLRLSNVGVDVVTLWAGERATVSWDGHNDSGTVLLGDWTDAVYLSADDQWDIDDVLLATVPHTGGLVEDEVYSGSVDVVIPGALPGDYYVIVRADLYNQEHEGGGEGNNIVAVGPIPLSVRPVVPGGGPASGTLRETDRFDYYAIDVEEGEYLKLDLDGLAPGAKAEVFVRYEAMPTRLEYDGRSATSPSGAEQAIVPPGPGGTHYVLVYGDELSGSSLYELTAEAAGIIVTETTPDRHGLGTACSMTITGGGFDSGTTVEFVASDDSVWTPTDIQVLSSTTMVVILDTPTWPQDVYDVVVRSPGGASYERANAFEVAAGEANFEAHIVVPGRMGRTWRNTIWIEYANTGGSSMAAPLLEVTGTDSSMLTLDPSLPAQRTSTFPAGVSDTVQVMATGSGATPGILQPGDSGRIPVYFLGLKAPLDMSDWEIDFSLCRLPPVDVGDDPIDWPGLKDEVRPEWIAADAWDAIWANLPDQVGATWRAYEVTLDANKNYLHTVGQDVSGVTELWAFEVQQARGMWPYRYLAGDVDAYVPTTGIPLVFGRVYGQSIDSRYELGPLGRGWSHNWDIHAEELSNGDVVIRGPGNRDRYFVKGDSGYSASSGDYGSLTISGGRLRLTEKHGTIWQFRSDSFLDYVEDTNDNRVTLGYTASQLTSLTHANGDQLLLDYNADGRIWHVTDPLSAGPADDRVTTYEYDVAGEHLLSVINPGGRITQYSYDTGNGLQREHALLSVEYPDGTHDYFTYDGRGKLVETHQDGGAEAITYAYDREGKVVVRDANGRQTVLYFALGGQLAQVRDGEGNVIGLGYDADHQLTQFTGGSGERYQYTYDSWGNVIGIEDPIRNDKAFTYTSSFKDLASVTDARGNGMVYDYDASGNLLSVTYEDATSESFTYDASGNALTWTNRRGDTVTYTYNAAGQVTSKDCPETPGIIDYEYVYDDAGNLTSATDPSGTIGMTHDPDTDWLTRIDYPGGRFFTFLYDDAGRRTQRTGQDDNVTNYLYDAVGRLDQMTDTADALIVDYDYDAAGRLSTKTLGNGVYTTYEYDNAGRLMHLVNYAPDDSIISRFDYTYDDSGRRTSMATLAGVYLYSYDPLGQLTGVTYPDGRVVSYTYDAVGNRIEVTDDGAPTSYATNDMNQYTAVGAAAYTFDADGNMVSKTEGGVTTTYTYDIESRLIGVTTPTDTWSYSYDAFGSRSASSHNGVATDYIVDPIGLGDVAAEYDAASGDLLARYDHGFGLVARTDTIGASAYYTFDAIGSTSELTDGVSGAVVSSYSYDPFGVSLGSTETVDNPFQYVGEYGVMHEDNGLAFMRARFYDSDIGRFTSPDPIGLSDGEVPLYRYALNRPSSLIDPRGLYVPLGWRPELISGKSWQDAGLALVGGLGKLLGPASAIGKVVARGKSVAGIDSLEGAALATAGVLAGAVLSGPAAIIVGAGFAVTGLSGFLGEASVAFQPEAGWGAWALDTLMPQFLRPVLVTPGPPTDLVDGGTGRIVRPVDPNDKLAPAGHGEVNFIREDSLLAYKIRFENMSDASAPAHKIVITDTLDEDLDLSTFELTEIGLADQTIVLPGGLTFYQAQMDLAVDNEYVSNGELRLQIDVGLDVDSRELTCTFTGLDPATGWLPEGIMLGILYPNDAAGRGDGYISYTVESVSGLPTGTEITNVASIVFDWNDPIDTPLVLNTIDAIGPTSSVVALPAETQTTELLVAWSGEDDAGGSGVGTYDMYVSTDGGDYALWLDDTPDTEAIFTGEDLRTYAFYSVATDNVGHVEGTPVGADASTTLNVWPAVTSDQLNGGDPQRSKISAIGLTFSEEVTVSSDGLTIHNDTTGEDFDLSSVPFDDLNHTWDVSGVALTEGDYTATFSATSVQDSSGNPLTGGYVFAFHVMVGDYDGNAAVDDLDIDELYANFGDAGQVGLQFDLDGDGDADQDDMDILVHDLVETTVGVGTEYGDFNLDGQINTTDLTILATNFGTGAKWSEGNANSDNTIDTTDLTILATNFGFVATPSGDMDGDSDADAEDIDLLAANMTGPGVPSDFLYDLDGDGDADQADMDMLVHDLVETIVGTGTEYGDFNLDGLIDTTDLTILATNFGTGTKWSEGNANSDNTIDTTDLTILATNFGFVATPAPPAGDTIGGSADVETTAAAELPPPPPAEDQPSAAPLSLSASASASLGARLHEGAVPVGVVTLLSPAPAGPSEPSSPKLIHPVAVTEQDVSLGDSMQRATRISSPDADVNLLAAWPMSSRGVEHRPAESRTAPSVIAGGRSMRPLRSSVLAHRRAGARRLSMKVPAPAGTNMLAPAPRRSRTVRPKLRPSDLQADLVNILDETELLATV